MISLCVTPRPAAPPAPAILRAYLELAVAIARAERLHKLAALRRELRLVRG